MKIKLWQAWTLLFVGLAVFEVLWWMAVLVWIPAAYE
jgi:hypothetical protein